MEDISESIASSLSGGKYMLSRLTQAAIDSKWNRIYCAGTMIYRSLLNCK